MMNFSIGGFLNLSLCDYPGRIAAVVFTQGCNFRCPFCHNGGLLPMKKTDGELLVAETVLEKLASRRGKLDGVVLSGGEPTLQPGLAAFLEQLRGFGFLIKLDTNGSNPVVLKNLLKEELLDFIAMDAKAPWPRYSEIAGVKVHVGDLKESVRVIAESGLEHEFRTTCAPRLLNANDLREIRHGLPSTSPHRLQRYVPRPSENRKSRLASIGQTRL